MTHSLKKFQSTCIGLGFLGLSIFSVGCGSGNCALTGNNLAGHVIFSSTVPLQTNQTVYVQFSTDSFTTTGASGYQGTSSFSNGQNLVSVPFSMCIPSDTNVSVRAYVDSAVGSGTWTSGKGAGRDDGTSNGNSTYNTRNAASGKKVDSVDITLDSTTAQ